MDFLEKILKEYKTESKKQLLSILGKIWVTVKGEAKVGLLLKAP